MTTTFSERDVRIAETIVSQIPKFTLMGCGFTGSSVVERGANLTFALARPYGRRRIEITLNYGDLYDITVYRWGKAIDEIKVTEFKDVFYTELADRIIEGIDQSCNPR
jgi:hypothetical protein